MGCDRGHTLSSLNVVRKFFQILLTSLSMSRGKNRLRNPLLDDLSGSRDHCELDAQKNLNGIQILILNQSYDQMILQVCEVLLLHSFWIRLVLSLWNQRTFCLSKKAFLTSSFWLDDRTVPGRNVAYLTNHVLGHRLILVHDHRKILVRGLRGPLLCDEAYEPSLSLDLLVPSWNRDLVCGRSFRGRQLHPYGVTSLVQPMILGTLRIQIVVVRL
jgi:hypothetical protein